MSIKSYNLSIEGFESFMMLLWASFSKMALVEAPL
jgi:hypothetical protein